MENKNNDLLIPQFVNNSQRQSPVAIILAVARFVKIIFRQLWPLFVVFIFNNKFKGDLFYTWVFSGIGLLSTIMSIIAYFRFYYSVEGEELIIQKGVLKKTKLNVPFNRIQSINSNQNLIHRFFNVVSLEMDTAGSKGSEIKIDALNKSEAEDLKTYILKQKEKLSPSTLDKEDSFSKIEEKEIIRLSISDLLKIGVSQNHIRSLGIIAATIFGLGEYADMFLDESEYEKMEFDIINIVRASFVILAVIALIAAVMITLTNTVIRFFDLRFLETNKGFKTISGLFNRNEKFITLQKLQVIRWVINPISQIFGMFQLYMSQAASIKVNRKQTLSVPGLYHHHIEKIKEVYFEDGNDLPLKSYTINWRIILRRLGKYGILPMLGFLLYKYLQEGQISYLPFLWPILILITSYIYWKKWGYHINEEGIQTEKGIFSTQFTLLKWYKIQSVKIRQSIFQKRRGLTDIYLYTASGVVMIPYIPIGIAQKIKNYILFKVETSTKKWM